MGRGPRGAVLGDVHEIPGGEGERVEALDEGAHRRLAHARQAVGPAPVREREAGNRVEYRA